MMERRQLSKYQILTSYSHALSPKKISLHAVVMNYSNQVTDILDLEKKKIPTAKNENISYRNTEQGPPT
jgi:hypothetical protein